MLEKQLAGLRGAGGRTTREQQPCRSERPPVPMPPSASGPAARALHGRDATQLLPAPGMSASGSARQKRSRPTHGRPVRG